MTVDHKHIRKYYSFRIPLIFEYYKEYKQQIAGDRKDRKLKWDLRASVQTKCQGKHFK